MFLHTSKPVYFLMIEEIITIEYAAVALIVMRQMAEGCVSIACDDEAYWVQRFIWQLIV